MECRLSKRAKDNRATRNGEIELLRFVFALFVMIFHFGSGLNYYPMITIGNTAIRLASRGGGAVTWFFLLSGVLFGASAKKLSTKRTENVGKCTGLFVKKKYAQYMTWFLPAFISATLLEYVRNGALKAAYEAFCGIPNFLLLGSLGFGLDSTNHIGIHVGASWFLSALFLVQMVLLPIIIQNYDLYIYVIAPITGALTIGFMRAGIFNFGLVFPKPFCLIILGTIAYEVSEKLNSVIISSHLCLFLNIVSRLVWIVYSIYLCIDGHGQMEYAFIFVMMASFAYVFSSHGRLRIFDNKVCLFLGAISFPLYLLHTQVFLWSEYISKRVSLPNSLYLTILILLSVTISAIGYFLASIWLKKRKLA
jgi:peptidoglycan/LPS O-acetylase OafA/YrhL